MYLFGSRLQHAHTWVSSANAVCPFGSAYEAFRGATAALSSPANTLNLMQVSCFHKGIASSRPLQGNVAPRYDGAAPPCCSPCLRLPMPGERKQYAMAGPSIGSPTGRSGDCEQLSAVLIDAAPALCHETCGLAGSPHHVVNAPEPRLCVGRNLAPCRDPACFHAEVFQMNLSLV